MIKVKPLHDRVLVERVDPQTKTAGGILLPDASLEKPMEGIVIATGEGAMTSNGVFKPIDVKVGDRVIFGRHSGSEIALEAKKYVMLREAELYAVLEEVSE